MTVPVIRVGVGHSSPAPGAEFGARWVEVDGVRLQDGVLNVRYDAIGAQFNTVTITFACQSFGTIDANGETEYTGHSGGFDFRPRPEGTDPSKAAEQRRRGLRVWPRR